MMYNFPDGLLPRRTYNFPDELLPSFFRKTGGKSTVDLQGQTLRIFLHFYHVINDVVWHVIKSMVSGFPARVGRHED